MARRAPVTARRRAARRSAAVVLCLIAAVGLSACTPSDLVAGSEVRIAVSAPLTSLNAASSHGRLSSTNAEVAALTGGVFGFRDARGELVLDESFGSAEVFALDPLTVRYEIAPGVRWSDGTALDAVDLLLAWAGGSGALADPGSDDPDARYFDGAATGGIEFATQTPHLGSEQVIFVHFDRYVPEWQTALAPGVAAHALAVVALDLDAEASAADAKAAVRDAIRTRDPVALAALSEVWNHGLDLDPDGDAPAPDPTLWIASGPYVVDALDDDGGVALRANPEYDGDRRPAYETIRLRVVADPREVIDLVRSGEIDVAAPPLGPEVAEALTDLDGVRLEYGIQTRIEHLELQFDDARHTSFDDPLVREAFLLTVPRAALVDELWGELAPGVEPLDSFVVGESAAAYTDVVTRNGSARFGEPDLVEAERLLAEAGETNPRVCILYDVENPQRELAYTLIADSAASAGFRVSDCSRPDWESALGVAGEYDAALFAWDTRALGPDTIGAVFRSDSAVANLNRYANTEVDRLIERLETPLTSEERAAALAAIDAALWADAYGVPLFSYPTVALVADAVGSVSPSPFAPGIASNAWEWRPAP